MGAEVKSKKRKGMIIVCLWLYDLVNWHGIAGVPDDEAAKVKKAKQMTADVLPKKRRGTSQGLRP